MTGDTIECPFCTEIIKAKAKKCRFCGEFLEIGLTKEAVLAEFEKGKQAASGQTEDVPVATAKIKAQDAQQDSSAEAEPPVVVASDSDEGDAETPPDPLDELYQKLTHMPDSPEKELVIETLQQLAMETQKGEEAEEGKVADMVETVAKALPDVAEITINTMINPASGLLTLVQKVAERVKGSQEKKEATEETAPEPQAGSTETGDTQAQAEAAPVEVNTETAADALGKVHEQLEQMPDSPEKELVEQTLQQLEAEPSQEEESDKSGV
ncbi:MAG: hypothetical protein SWK90_16865, partial [Chloroflexota bacterium]|nr:hypothetical protein [Chloroflexota bacterium]